MPNMTLSRRRLLQGASVAATAVLTLGGSFAQQAARNAAPTQRGPDANRVYPVKIDGAPMEGPITAAVTIAEFSDFQ